MQSVGRLDEAITCYRRALALQPDTVETLDNLAGALQARGELDAAQAVYERALALRSGASGFLLKNALPEELLHAVHVVTAGEALLAPSVTRRIIEQFAALAGHAGVGTRLDALTQREREVLTMLARGKSNAELAAGLFVTEGTIKTHVSSLLAKLGLRDRVQAVVLAYESGLVTPGA